MKHLFALTAILVISIVSIGALCCASHNEDLSGTSWRLAEYGVQASPAAILDRTTITLNFNEDLTRITGNGGCNDYFADCVIEGGNITVTNLGSTKMNNDDPPGTMNQENDYFNLLKTAESFELNGGELTINCSGRDKLVFEKIKSNSTGSLKATSWELESYGAASQQKNLLPNTAVTLIFDISGTRFSGNAGVNLYGGKYATQGTNINMTEMVMTLMLRTDPPGIMQQETDYLTLLEASESFSIDGNSLTIYCSGGEELHFRAD